MTIFRATTVGTRQRLIHWMHAAASLFLFFVVGTPGLFMAYTLGLLLLHVRVDRVRGYNAMDRLLQWREHALALEWKAFLGARNRRAVSLHGPRPHRFLSAAFLIILLVLSVLLGEVANASAIVAAAVRLGVALAASAAMWMALFGLSRRTVLVFGVDGVRVGEAFVAYSAMRGFTPRPDRVVIERCDPLPPIVIVVPDLETAERLVTLLSSERDRALSLREEPTRPLLAVGFRESSSQVGWRVRLLGATSPVERDALVARMAPEELREVLDGTADPTLEDALHSRLRRGG